MNFEKYNGICVLLIAIMFFMPVNVLTAEQEKNRATVTLIDEGFEDGIPTDWTNTGWILNWYGFPHSGSNWVSASGSGSLLQTPSLTFGDNTQLSFWYAAESGTMSMRVEIDSDEVWSKTFSNTAYEQANVDLSSYTGTHTVSFICTSSGFYVENLDDILITTELELTPPTITNVDAQPPIQTTGGSVEITCDVTDDTGVDTVYANITYPDATTSSHVMSNAGGNSYSFSQSYNQNGIHEYHIYAIDIDGNSAESSTYTFEIDDPPTAEFTYSPSDPTTQDTVQFTDQSTDFDGSIVSWSWDFGDGATSTLENPTHQFDEGTYTVILTVTDDDGATDMHTDTVTVSNVGPIADFSYSPSDPTTAELVTFTDGSSDVDGSVVSWSWDFGDGGTSSQSDPTYSYSDDGTYTVTLTVTDDDGATDSYSDTVVVANIGPTAEFTYSPSDPTTQDTVQFTDQSTDFDGSIVSWSWDFGDGATSTLENPTHQFDEGTYTVILTVTDDDGATDMHTDTVTVSNVGPIADFSYSPTTPSTLDDVSFTDLSVDSDGSISSWSWDFDDGVTSSDQHPIHSFSTVGTYQVSLTVTDDDGATNSVTISVEITDPVDTVDINQSVFDRGFPVRNTSNGHWAGAQNFTPTVNIITSVGLYMRTFGEPSFDLIVELREDGVEGLVLDTVTFTPSEIDDSWSWLNIDFVDVPVEEGIDYFIVLKPPVNGVYDTFGYEWGFALDNQYEDGSFWYNRDPILTPYWRDLPDVYEFTFKVNGLT